MAKLPTFRIEVKNSNTEALKRINDNHGRIIAYASSEYRKEVSSLIVENTELVLHYMRTFRLEITADDNKS